ncbi:MAG: M15 family metallopeptidase [Candidatus Nanopelagicales bacterium]
MAIPRSRLTVLASGVALAVAFGVAAPVTAVVGGESDVPEDSLTTNERPRDEIPADAGPVIIATAGVADAVSLSVTTNGRATGTVEDSYDNPVSGVQVSITATSSSSATLTASATTNTQGEFSADLPLLSGTYTVIATADGATSAPATVTNSASLSVSANVATTTSELGGSLNVRVRDLGRPANANISVTVTEPVGNPNNYTARTGADGAVTIPVKLWRNPSINIVATRNGGEAATTVAAETLPRRKPVKLVGPQPRNTFPLTKPPVGSGANAKVARINNDQWAQMQNLTWRPGCVSRSRLRMIDVNYLGFDGFRHRGRVIVSASIGSKAAKIFTRLHNRGYPIRQMQPVDTYGPNVGRPGANDYKSMAADNTSAFNCRYVVGRESSRVRSPHASGRAIDINPWENPYVAATGVFPNRHYLNRRIKHPSLFKSGRVGLNLVRSTGCRWGGGYADYHHFDC